MIRLPGKQNIINKIKVFLSRCNIFICSFSTALIPQNKDDRKLKTNSKILNLVCPVRGDKISLKVPTVIYEGKIFGFYCNGYDSKFMKEPEKYIKNLSPDGKKFIVKKSK